MGLTLLVSRSPDETPAANILAFVDEHIFKPSVDSTRSTIRGRLASCAAGYGMMNDRFENRPISHRL
jgi:hypothetical protein